jgi:hypothetical protein
MTFSAMWPTAAASNLVTNLTDSCDKNKQDKAIASAARQCRDIAKTLAPHGATGNLARSIYARKVSDAVWEVGSPLIYAWAVEFGSGVYGEGPAATGEPIEPKSSDYLSFQIGGDWKRVRFVLGQHPQPFLRPAVERIDGNQAKTEMFD